MFDGMFAAAIERLRNRSPEEICRLGNVAFDGSAFRFESLGREMAVSYPEYEVLPAVDPWQALVMLHYLSMAGGAPMEGKMIAFSEYRDGLARGYGFDRDTENAIRERAGALSEDELKKRCLALGGRLVASNADLCAEFKFMPNYPVWLKIWFADDEFPTSGKIFVDASAEKYLSIEDAVTVGRAILDSLIG